MSEKTHYWNSVVEVSGPQSHQVKRYNLTLATLDTIITKQGLESLVTKGILLRQEEAPETSPDQYRAVVYGPFYIGEQDTADFEVVE